MLNLLALALVLIGTGLLLSALVPVGRLIQQIPFSPVRRRWYLMAVLIGFFVAGYMGYVVVFWGRHTDVVSLMVPSIFFLGAGFVWLTATLSFQTAADIRRVVLLEQESITDPLLGIYNRRYLDRRLEEECARARRYGLPLFVLLLDLDLFKPVNDAYGHQVGDQVLACLGQLILREIRESDIAVRYGGDELLIIAPNTTAAAALALAERLRQHVAAHTLAVGGTPSQRQEIRLTVSIGLTGLVQETLNGQQLVQQADAALYRAKQAGRNRVAAHRVD